MQEVDDLVRIVSQLDISDRGLPAGQLGVPQVRLEDGFLAWDIESAEIVPMSGLHRVLVDFVELGKSQSVKPFLDFARNYGPLFLCERHGLPALHPTLSNEQAVLSWSATVCLPKFRYRGDDVICQLKTPSEFLENPERWRFWAKHARAILNLGSELGIGRPGKSDDWLTAIGIEPADNRERPAMLARAIRIWLRAAPRPQMDLVATDSGRLEIRFISGLPANRLSALRAALCDSGPLESVYVGGIFSILAEKLAAAVSGGTVEAICSGCAQFYRPKRAPALGRHHFCERCGKRASWRLSKRRARDQDERAKV